MGRLYPLYWPSLIRAPRNSKMRLFGAQIGDFAKRPYGSAIWHIYGYAYTNRADLHFHWCFWHISFRFVMKIPYYIVVALCTQSTNLYFQCYHKVFSRENRPRAGWQRATSKAAGWTPRRRAGTMGVDMTVATPTAAPTAARKRSKRKVASPESEPQRAALAVVESAVAGRSLGELWDALPAAEWQRVFDTQPVDSPGAKLQALRTDPSSRDWSLERQCAEAGVSAAELAKMVSELALNTAIIASSQHLAAVVDGVGESAKPLLLVCDLCLGLRDGDDPSELTYIEVDHPRRAGEKLKIECPKCAGLGRTRRDANPRAVETFLKLHGGLIEEQGPALQLNQQFNFGSQHSLGVHRGQQLLEQGRQGRRARNEKPITVTATPINVDSGAS